MVTYSLSTQLSGHIFPFMIVFTRLGAALMLFPGIGESFVSIRIRLFFALAFSFLVFPVLMPDLPALPKHIPDLARLIAQEAVIGVFFGSLLRLLMGAIETTGSIVAVQVGLSNAMILNPAMAMQSALPSAFLGVAGIVLLFLTGLDHMLLRGLIETYRLFPVKELPVMGDMAQTYVHLVTSSFTVGVEIAAPFLVVGLMLFVALGFMQRLVAQVQLFLVLLPLQIWGGLFLFGATLGVMMSVWLKYFDSSFAALMTR